MTPEQAVARADAIASAHRGHLVSRDEVRAEALYQYVLASRTWRPGRGASFTTYAKRRMEHAAEDAHREHFGRTIHTYAAGLCLAWAARDESRSEPQRLIRRIRRATSRRAARVAWLYYGLEYDTREIGELMGFSKERAWQLLREVQKEMIA